MRYVIDASATVAACTGDSGFAILGSNELIAPSLLWSESAAALHLLWMRRSMTEDLAAAAFERLLEAPVEVRADKQLLQEAWRVATDLGWARTYDAEYVALARIVGCPLITMDERLRRGASRVADIVDPTQVS